MAKLSGPQKAEEDSVVSHGHSDGRKDIVAYRRQRLCQLIGQECDLTKLKFMTLVHNYLDTDATLSAHSIGMVLAEQGVKVAHVDSVSSSSPIDYNSYHKRGYDFVIPADVGRGRFDQHTKRMERGSSFELIVDYFDLWNIAGIEELVELARATDNVEKVAKVSIHYYFKGLPRRCRDKESGEINWALYIQEAFEFLNGFYKDRHHELNSQARFERKKAWVMKELKNGLTVAQLGRDASLRDAAYENGADCCVFFDNTYVAGEVKTKVEDAACVIIQLHRNHTNNPQVKLQRLAAAMRFQESKKRGVDLNSLGVDTTRSDVIPELGLWYLHPSGNNLLCGSRSSPIEKVEQHTMLTRKEIYGTVRRILGDIDLRKNERKPTHQSTSAKKKTEEPKKAPEKVQLKASTRTAKAKKVTKKALTSKSVVDGLADKGWKVKVKVVKKAAKTKKKPAAKKKAAKAKKKQ
jgi:hypothetical protein